MDSSIKDEFKSMTPDQKPTNEKLLELVCSYYDTDKTAGELVAAIEANYDAEITILKEEIAAVKGRLEISESNDTSNIERLYDCEKKLAASESKSKGLELALKNIICMLGEGACSNNKCPGCKYEMNAAASEAKASLGMVKE